jgi:hypothetical protein
MNLRKDFVKLSTGDVIPVRQLCGIVITKRWLWQKMRWTFRVKITMDIATYHVEFLHRKAADDFADEVFLALTLP